MMPGLFDKRMYVDAIDNILAYDAQELTYAEDKEYYCDNFFINQQEEEYVINQANFVTDIEGAIFDSLLIIDED